MRYEWFIARRYLRAKHRTSLISLITLLSVVGVNVGVAALVVVLSVFNGFFNLVTGLLVSFDPDVRVEALGPRGVANPDSLSAVLRSLPGVRSTSPYVEGKALAIGRAGEPQGMIVRGVEEAHYGRTEQVRAHTHLGRFTLGTDGMVVGIGLADALGAGLGDTLSLVSPAGLVRAATQLSAPPTVGFSVTGVFTVQRLYDANHAFISLEAARDLFRLRDGRVTGVELDLVDIAQADEVKRLAIAQLGPTYKVETWYDLHRELYTVMRLEKWGAYLILSLIIAVAAFNIVGSQTMVVIEKTRDIGVLKAMGAGRRSILRIFLLEGLLIGLAGVVIGGGIGLLVVYLQGRFGLVKILNADSFIIDAYPVSVEWTDLVAIAVSALVLCLLASLYPARRAAALVPVDAIRYE